MTVLDTFYLLFKTDAKDAKNDITALDKQISNLAAKGKQRSDEEQKELKELRKQRQDATRDLKDQTEQTDKLGQSFVKMIEGGAQAATAFFAFSAIKSGVVNAAQFNSALEVQGKLIGQNAGKLQAYAAAAQSAGGTQEGFLGSIQGIFQSVAASGLSTPDVSVLLDRLRAGAKQYNTQAGKELYFQRLGISDPGLKTLLEQSDVEYAKTIQDAKEHAQVTEKDTEAAREFGKEWAATTQALNTLFSKLGTEVFPYVNAGLEKLNKFLNEITGSTPAINLFFGAMAVGALTAASAVGKLAKSLLGLGSAGTGFFGKLGLFGLVASAPEIGSEAGSLVGDWIKGGGGGAFGKWLTDKSKSIMGTKRSDSSIGASDIEKQSYAFWVSQGYSPAQASAIVGNQRGEGWKNNNSIGDNGTAFGIAQWHMPRVNDILKNTGIDVRTASLADQLKAQAWEMQNRYAITPSTLPDNVAGGAKYLVRNYEFTGNQGLDAMKRAGFAAEIAQQNLNASSSTPLNAGTYNSNTSGDTALSIKTGDINVHTQATDAQGISMGIGSALISEYRNAFSNWDDGVGG